MNAERAIFLHSSLTYLARAAHELVVRDAKRFGYFFTTAADLSRRGPFWAKMGPSKRNQLDTSFERSGRVDHLPALGYEIRLDSARLQATKCSETLKRPRNAKGW